MVYSCLVCQDPRERLAYNCKSHEQSIAHQNHLKSFHPTTPNVLGTSQSPHLSSSVPTAVTPDEVIKEDAIRALILSLSAQPNKPTNIHVQVGVLHSPLLWLLCPLPPNPKSTVLCGMNNVYSSEAMIGHDDRWPSLWAPC